MKIELATLSNAKLLQYFPVDPYFDLEVKSATGEYKLQIAFLSIESEFFEEVYSTKQRTVDLSHLPEPYLEGVLRALYGDGLVIETFNDLRNYFTVIEYLRVGEYRQGIIDGLQARFAELNPLELLEFCCCNHILEEMARKSLIDDNLQVLQDRKYYLQLNLVSSEVMVSLLNEFLRVSPEVNREYTVNSVLDSYLTRNKIDPCRFFNEPGREELQRVWELWHPRTLFENLLTTQNTESDELPKIPKVPLVCDSLVLKKEERISQLQAEVDMQARRIRELERLTESYRETIAALQEENRNLRERSSSPPRLVNFEEDDVPQRRELLVQSYLPELMKKDLNFDPTDSYCHTDPGRQEFFDDENLAMETPVPNSRLTPTQDVKTLNQLKSQQRTKKIFG